MTLMLSTGFILVLLVALVHAGPKGAGRPIPQSKSGKWPWKSIEAGRTLLNASSAPLWEGCDSTGKENSRRECNIRTLSYHAELTELGLPYCPDGYGVIEGYRSARFICGPLMYTYDKETQEYQMQNASSVQVEDGEDRRLSSFGEFTQHYIENIASSAAWFGMKVEGYGTDSTDISVGCSGTSCAVVQHQTNSKAWVLSGRAAQGGSIAAYHYRNYYGGEASDRLTIAKDYAISHSGWVQYGVYTSSVVDEVETSTYPRTMCSSGDFTQAGCASTGFIITGTSSCLSGGWSRCNSGTTCLESVSGPYYIIECSAYLTNGASTTSYSQALYYID